VVTKPFSFEGAQRARIAQEAALKLKERVDTLIVVPNDRIFSVIKKDTPLMRAFEYIDDVLRHSVQGIAELIAMPGIINVDFADVKTVMKDAGSALVGIGLAAGQERALNAVDQAVHSPLLEVSIDGAKGILFAVSGGKDMRLNEIHDVAKIIGESVDPAAKIIFGAYHDRKLKKGILKVILIATGFNGSALKNGDSSIVNLFASPKMAAEEASVIEKAPEKETKGKKKTGDDVWDIPTFLRKKK
jgi:cell division protein FtsZ